jgi:wobble nucleotide-excising tRNase
MNMTNVVIIKDLEEEVKAIRALEAKINELDELKKEKEALVKKVLDEAGLE